MSIQKGDRNCERNQIKWRQGQETNSQTDTKAERASLIDSPLLFVTRSSIRKGNFLDGQLKIRHV